MKNELAMRYGQGLFELAQQQNLVAEMLEEVEGLKKIFQNEPSLSSALKAVRINKNEKHELINRLFSGKLKESLINLIHLMVDRKRVDYIEESLSYFEELALEEMGIKQAMVYSARPLSIEQVEKIKEKLEKDFQSKILLKNEVEENLIAGIKVRIGNKVMDYSTQNQIEQLKQRLLKGAQG